MDDDEDDDDDDGDDDGGTAGGKVPLLKMETVAVRFSDDCSRSTLTPDHLEYYFSMNRRRLRRFGGEIIF